MIVTIVKPNPRRNPPSLFSNIIFRVLEVCGENIIVDNHTELRCNLNFIDTSEIKSMASLFSESNFNGNISEWDVSSVINMFNMFADSNFNGDISSWDVSNVEFMSYMFSSSMFNRDISMWEVGEGCDYFFIFDNCPLENKPEFQPKFNKK